MATPEDLQKILEAWYNYKYSAPHEQREKEVLYENLLQAAVQGQSLTAQQLKLVLQDRQKTYVRQRRKRRHLAPS